MVELLVAMTLFSVVMAMVGGLFVSVVRANDTARVVDANTRSASVGMSEVTRVLRFASTIPKLGQTLPDPAFVAVGNETVTVYSYVDTNAANPKPSRVQFSLDSARRLIETRWPMRLNAAGYWELDSALPTTRILTEPLEVWSTGKPRLFTYLVANGSELAAPTSAQLVTIAAVQVTLSVQSAPSARAVVVQNTVGLSNLGIKRTGQG